MAKPKISIIIPVFNTEKYIEKCFQSLLGQTFSDFEALVVDDGSTDRSIEIAKKICADDPRFIFLHQKNHGAGAARNLGIDRALGDYFCFVDSDDYVAADFLERMFGKISAQNADIVVTDVYLVHQKSTRRIAAYQLSENPAQSLLLGNAGGLCPKIFRREMFIDVRLPDIQHYEDIVVYLSILLAKKPKISYLPEAIYYYVQTQNSNARRTNQNLIDETFAALAMVKKMLQKFAVYENLKTDYQIFYINAMTNIAQHIEKFADKKNAPNLRRFIEKTDKNIFNRRRIFALLRQKNRGGLVSKKIYLAAIFCSGAPGRVIFRFLVRAKVWLFAEKLVD